jgi:putative acetyltransferase
MPHQLFTIRKALLSDLAALQAVFVDSIQTSCQNDYNPKQIRVWCASIQNTARWERSLREDFFLVAEHSDQLIGFASLHKLSYLDFMYVHPQFQKQGVAGQLYQLLEEEAMRNKVVILQTEASITAKRFFEKKGFSEQAKQEVFIDGISLINYKMSKIL